MFEKAAGKMSSLADQHVLVTGATGFIGRHLVEELLIRGAKVTGLARSEGPRTLKTDIRDRDQVKNAFKAASTHAPISYVFHLAGQKNMLLAKADPFDALSSSIDGTLNLLESCREVGNLRKFVVASSMAVYEPSAEPYREENLLKRNSIYAAGKIAAESIALAYSTEAGVPATVARLANVYGPGQSSEAVLGSMIRQMLTEREISLGNTNAVRDFIYVQDTVEAMIALALSENTAGRPFNIGTGIGSSIQTLVEHAARHTSFKGSIKSDSSRVRSGEVSIVVPEISAIQLATGWKAKRNLDEGVRLTVQAFREN